MLALHMRVPLAATAPDTILHCIADNGTIFITWATGSYVNYTVPSSNYVNGTGVYAPQFPDPSSVASIVSGYPFSFVQVLAYPQPMLLQISHAVRSLRDMFLKMLRQRRMLQWHQNSQMFWASKDVMCMCVHDVASSSSAAGQSHLCACCRSMHYRLCL